MNSFAAKSLCVSTQHRYATFFRWIEIFVFKMKRQSNNQNYMSRTVAKYDVFVGLEVRSGLQIVSSAFQGGLQIYLYLMII